MRNKSVGVGVANTSSIVKDVIKSIMVMMMSEKRLASSGDSFVDLTEMQIVDLLNKLSDENTRLHKKVDEQQAEIERLQKIIDLTQYQLKVQDRILKEVGE